MVDRTTTALRAGENAEHVLIQDPMAETQTEAKAGAPTEEYKKPTTKDYRQEALRCIEEAVSSYTNANSHSAAEFARTGLLTLRHCGDDFEQRILYQTHLFYILIASERRRSANILRAAKKEEDRRCQKFCTKQIARIQRLLQPRRRNFIHKHAHLLPQDAIPPQQIIEQLELWRGLFEKLLKRRGLPHVLSDSTAQSPKEVLSPES